jgi:hypothetical protein
MRSADIVKNCREVALRVEISGEWGELGDTLRLAATEIERLRRAVKSWERESQAHAAEVERLRLTPDEVKAIEYGISKILDHDWYGGPEPERVVALRSLLARQGGGE